jgi:hypothetical protein
VVIYQIDVRRMPIFEFEDQPPIPGYGCRPFTMPVTFERMKPVPWRVQRGWLCAVMEQDQHAPQLGCELRINPACIPARE